MNNRKCGYCANWTGKECCNCQFKYNEYYTGDEWDILNLNEEEGWEHLQILNRLHSQGIECLFADIWTHDNIAFLVGCNADDNKIARVLGVHEVCIYNDFEHSFVIINLFQEKYIRRKENDK